METKDDYEYKHLRICEKGLQRVNCSKCIFEVLCHYEKMQEKLKENKKKSDLSNNNE